jgi:hypothetical protein
VGTEKTLFVLGSLTKANPINSSAAKALSKVLCLVPFSIKPVFGSLEPKCPELSLVNPAFSAPSSSNPELSGSNVRLFFY